jgi:hypothetical protein
MSFGVARFVLLRGIWLPTFLAPQDVTATCDDPAGAVLPKYFSRRAFANANTSGDFHGNCKDSFLISLSQESYNR